MSGPDTEARVPEAAALSMAIALAKIQPSKSNPRSRFDQADLEDLATSIGRHGVLQPVLVRRVKAAKAGIEYELVCGERRFRASQIAKRESIPATIHDLSDEEVIEIQLVENLQRSDLHVLEEADGYHRLMTSGKYDVARLSKRIGRSIKYVYDRVKLLQLTPEARKLLLEDRITPGHAILLARLKAADQARVLKDGMFQREELLFGPEEHNALPQKVRSVREVDGWIDEHVRFDPGAVDPMLFPETAENVTKAESIEFAGKVRLITFANYVDPLARGQEKVFFPRSWRRADGLRKSKTCDMRDMGVVIAGQHRGESFIVCVNKNCTTHFPEQARAAKRRAAAAAKASKSPAGTTTVAAKPKPAPKPRGLRENDVINEMMEETYEALCAAAAKADVVTVLRCTLLAEIWRSRDGMARAGLKASSTEQFIRTAKLPQLQAVVLGGTLDGIEADDVSEIAAALKVDLRPFVRAARIRLVAKAKETVAGICKKCGCTDDDACPGGCSWIDAEETLCSRCAPVGAALLTSKHGKNAKASKPKPAPKKKGGRK